jgi:hypothetical protein
MAKLTPEQKHKASLAMLLLLHADAKCTIGQAPFDGLSTQELMQYTYCLTGVPLTPSLVRSILLSPKLEKESCFLQSRLMENHHIGWFDNCGQTLWHVSENQQPNTSEAAEGGAR